jgi:hypothetical protein
VVASRVVGGINCRACAVLNSTATEDDTSTADWKAGRRKGRGTSAARVEEV